MTEIGKFAIGLKGFPTPDIPTGSSGYLLFYFPDKTWAQYILGAAKALDVGYNWYKSGELDVDEAAEAFRVITQDAPYNTKTCSNPAGGKIIRVAPSGHVEQLGNANEWETPDGDYTIPPVPEREEPGDIKCLAARNAANVLFLLYETVSDAFAAGLAEAAGAVALIEAISLIVGVEFAPITFAIVSVSSAIFGAFYSIMEFVTADLWDTSFTEAMVCILYGCAVEDEGVVTFDWECFNNRLAEQVNVFDLSFTQLRLFGQIQYLLWLTGGVDALNLAGATNEITDDDCDDCGEWCRVYNAEFGWGAWYAGGGYATLVGGVWQSGSAGGDSYVCAVDYDFTDIELTSINVVGTASTVANGGGRGLYRLNLPAVDNFFVGSTDAGDVVYDYEGEQVGTFTLQANIDSVNSGTMNTITEIVLHGTGTPPPDGEPC